jgi:tRNA1(Val) A37 N6-methylase TrmN6
VYFIVTDEMIAVPELQQNPLRNISNRSPAAKEISRLQNQFDITHSMKKVVTILKFDGSIINVYLKIRIAAMLNLLMTWKLRVQVWKTVNWNVVHSKSHKIRINGTAVRGEYTRT